MALDYEGGKLDKRLEAAINTPLDDAITEVARQLAGSKNPKQFRSKAARKLLAAGAKAMKVGASA